MLMNLAEASALIKLGKPLHIAASSDLLGKLPQGNWIGGSTEYFMTANGGYVGNDVLFVDELSAEAFRIRTYDAENIHTLVNDTYENGYSIIILPFDSDVHKVFAQNAATYEDIFLKNIIGWVSGVNLSVAGQVPVAVNGEDMTISSDHAMVIHVSLTADKMVNIGMINIFEEAKNSPVFEFDEDSFTVTYCTVDGEKVLLADYISDNNINTQLPLIGDFSGAYINVSIKSISDGVVYLYAPVFKGISYKIAHDIADYAGEFKRHLESFKDVTAVFSCNCILNFLYGELEGKQAGSFIGPITFGEVAFQLVNQTLVYLVII